MESSAVWLAMFCLLAGTISTPAAQREIVLFELTMLSNLLKYLGFLLKFNVSKEVVQICNFHMRLKLNCFCCISLTVVISDCVEEEEIYLAPTMTTIAHNGTIILIGLLSQVAR